MTTQDLLTSTYPGVLALAPGPIALVHWARHGLRPPMASAILWRWLGRYPQMTGYRQVPDMQHATRMLKDQLCKSAARGRLDQAADRASVVWFVALMNDFVRYGTFDRRRGVVVPKLSRARMRALRTTISHVTNVPGGSSLLPSFTEKNVCKLLAAVVPFLQYFTGAPSSFLRGTGPHDGAAIDLGFVAAHPTLQKRMDPLFHLRPAFLATSRSIADVVLKTSGVQTVVEDNHYHLHVASAPSVMAAKLPSSACLAKTWTEHVYVPAGREAAVINNRVHGDKVVPVDEKYIATAKRHLLAAGTTFPRFPIRRKEE